MHSAVEVLGPGSLALIALLLVVWALSAFVTVDSLRRRALDYTGVREGRWFYAVGQGVFFVVFGLEQIPAAAAALPWLGYVQIALIPFAVAHQIAYLLRVVFPTQSRIDARAAAGASASRSEERRTSGTGS